MHHSQQTKQQYGDYQLLHLLGQSGSSEVYLGEHIHNHTQGAVKLLWAQGKDDNGQKFLTQTATISHFQHPHIVQILDFGLEHDRAFLVMNYATGGTLRRRHPKGMRVPFNTVLVYARQVASALHYVHEQGLIHRDVKPHNLLLDTNESVLLSDFGAAVASYSIDPIQTHDFEGTILYAAPEQLQGKACRYSDQYSLGVVIYEWMSGNWLFSGTFHEVAHQHLFVTPPPLLERGVICPPDIERVLLRSLEKIPEKRFPSVKLFIEELEWAYKVARAKGFLSVAQTQSTEYSSQQTAKQQFKSPFISKKL